MKTDTRAKTVEVCPLMDIERDRYQVDLYSKGNPVLRIQTAELPDNLEPRNNEVLVEDPNFRAVIRQLNGCWLAFVGMRVLRPKIIKRIVEIVSDISGIRYYLDPDKRPGDELPFRQGG